MCICMCPGPGQNEMHMWENFEEQCSACSTTVPVAALVLLTSLSSTAAAFTLVEIGLVSECYLCGYRVPDVTCALPGTIADVK